MTEATGRSRQEAGTEHGKPGSLQCTGACRSTLSQLGMLQTRRFTFTTDRIKISASFSFDVIPACSPLRSFVRKFRKR